MKKVIFLFTLVSVSLITISSKFRETKIDPYQFVQLEGFESLKNADFVDDNKALWSCTGPGDCCGVKCSRSATDNCCTSNATCVCFNDEVSVANQIADVLGVSNPLELAEWLQLSDHHFDSPPGISEIICDDLGWAYTCE